MDTQAAVRGNAETEKASSFDVIVIGAGVAGLYHSSTNYASSA